MSSLYHVLKIFLFFSKTSKIVISQKTISCFQYLSEVWENAYLFSTCGKVRFTGKL
jgi:hypothetical protein